VNLLYNVIVDDFVTFQGHFNYKKPLTGQYLQNYIIITGEANLQ